MLTPSSVTAWLCCRRRALAAAIALADDASCTMLGGFKWIREESIGSLNMCGCGFSHRRVPWFHQASTSSPRALAALSRDDVYVTAYSPAPKMAAPSLRTRENRQARGGAHDNYKLLVDQHRLTASAGVGCRVLGRWRAQEAHQLRNMRFWSSALAAAAVSSYQCD